MSKQKIYTCPFCGSTEVFHFQFSGDHDGCEFEPMNSDEAYVSPLAEQYDFLIDVGYCACCKRSFDLTHATHKETVITATDLEGRIANVKAALKREEENRKYKCAAIRTNVLQTVYDSEMLRHARLFDELNEITGRIAVLENLASELQHILEQDSVEKLIIAEAN